MKVWVKFVCCCFHLSKKSPPPLRNPGYTPEINNGNVEKITKTLRITFIRIAMALILNYFFRDEAGIVLYLFLNFELR